MPALRRWAILFVLGVAAGAGLLVGGCAGGESTSLNELADRQSPPATEVPLLPTLEPVTDAPSEPPPAPTPTVTAVPEVRVGAEVLAESGFALLAGKRVGLVANQTSTVRGVHLVDLLAAAPNVTLVAAFAPEHGLRGDLGAGEVVADETVGTGDGQRIPVYSLYGTTRAPTAESLAGIDVIVYDLQDVGSRFYTYISTMGLVMQSAAAAGIEVVVLDRPNPQGDRVEGFVLDRAFGSFVGQYPIPATYGLTAGELVRMIVGKRWMPGLDGLELTVVEIADYDRSSRSLMMPGDWVPPSPGLPTFDSALVYPGTVLFEATNLSVGRGTPDTFRLIGAPWVDPAQLAAELTRRADVAGLGGVVFEPHTFVPVADARSATPDYEGQELGGVRVVVTDADRFAPVAVGVHLLVAFRDAGFEAGAGDIVTRPEWLDLLTGTDRFRALLFAGQSADTIIAAWAEEVAAFKNSSAPYRLYD